MFKSKKLRVRYSPEMDLYLLEKWINPFTWKTMQIHRSKNNAIEALEKAKKLKEEIYY